MFIIDSDFGAAQIRWQNCYAIGKRAGAVPRGNRSRVLSLTEDPDRNSGSRMAG